MAASGRGATGAAFALALALCPALADPPDFSAYVDLGSTGLIDADTGVVDPYLGATLNGTMSGSFDNGVGYSLGGDVILERHNLFARIDASFLKASGQLNYQTDLGKIRLRASNLSVFDRSFAIMRYNLTDLSLGMEDSYDLTDDLRLKLSVNVARRLATVQTLDRWSINPTVSLTTQLAGLDVYAYGSYSYRDFVFRDRVDHYFSTGATMSKTFDDLTVGVSASVETVRSSVPSLGATSFIVGPNLTYNLPID